MQDLNHSQSSPEIALRLSRLLAIVVCPVCGTPFESHSESATEATVGLKISCPSCHFEGTTWKWLGGSIDLFAPKQESWHRDSIERHSQLIDNVADWGTPLKLNTERACEISGYDYAHLEDSATPPLIYGKYYHDYTKRLICDHVAEYVRRKGAARILELGCGHGIMAPFVLDKMGLGQGKRIEYLMTDVIGDSLKKSEQYFRHIGFDWNKVMAFTCNGERIPLPDNSVDIVFLMETIEHFERPHIGFREFHRVLKPGGLCMITTPRPSQSFYFARIKLLGRIWPYKGFAKHLMIDYSLCDENFYKYVQQNGFKETTCKFHNVVFPLVNQVLLRVLHFPWLVRLYACFNLRLLSRFFPLFRKAQFRVLEK